MVDMNDAYNKDYADKRAADELRGAIDSFLEQAQTEHSRLKTLNLGTLVAFRDACQEISDHITYVWN